MICTEIRQSDVGIAKYWILPWEGLLPTWLPRLVLINRPGVAGAVL